MSPQPETGEPDGQLSAVGIMEVPPEYWPSLIERDGFADLATVHFNLSAAESAVFRRICFRAGSKSQGCWESAESMGRYLALHEKTVRRALAKLTDIGLVHKISAAFRTKGRSFCYLPVLKVSVVPGMVFRYGQGVQNGQSAFPVLDTESQSSGHGARLTEGTEIVTDRFSGKNEFQENQDELFDLSQSQFLPDTESRTQDDTPARTGHRVQNAGRRASR